MQNKQARWNTLIIVLVLTVLIVPSVLAVTPSGSTITKINSSTAPTDVAGSDSALAGNVTELTITGRTTTQTWQGYFGNVTGVIQLADGSSKVMYNWSLASPTGEVYASTNQTIYWNNIQCFNFTAAGNYTAETGLGGTTSKYGTNLTQLQNVYGINVSDVDSVNATFNLLGAGTHAQFYTANKQFTQGQCPNTRIYDNTGAGVAGKFEEVLQYEPQSASIVYTSLLNKDAMGFDSKTHDFEMLVPENGHGTDTASTPYYFYVELQ